MLSMIWLLNSEKSILLILGLIVKDVVAEVHFKFGVELLVEFLCVDDAHCFAF